MGLERPRGVPVVLTGDQRRLEYQVLALQSTIAAFFVAGTLAGWFGTHSAASRLGAAWIAAYHLVHAGYIVRWRIRGTPIRAIENAMPLLDVSCVTTAWVVLGDAHSPFWAVYLYALVGYGRRYHSRRYVALASFILLNVAGGWIAIGLAAGHGVSLETDLWTMLVITAAMAALSHAIGSAWRNAERRARILSETDPLTSIANRRYFLDRLEALAAPPDQGFTVLMLDLDDFKHLNDEFGHLHGDDVLANVARLLAQNVGPTDLLARYGGEEFVIAMPETALHEATETAERLRKAIFEATPITVSIGCAARELNEHAESVLRRADDTLLAVKRSGKNAVRAHRPRRAA
jgi:diguanylate cyclase (GGDEF)-like protein